MHLKSLALIFGALFAMTLPSTTVHAAGPQEWELPKKKKKPKKQKPASTTSTPKASSSTKKQSYDPDEDYRIVLSQLKRKQYSSALPRLKRIVKVQPRNADAWSLIGFASRLTGKMEQSKKAYRTALSIEPDHRGAHAYMGAWRLQKDDLGGAMKLYRRLAEICPDGCRERSELERDIVKFSIASFNADQVITLQSKLADTGFYKGELDGKFGKGSIAALKSFQRAQRIDEVGVFDETRAALSL